MPFLDLLLFGAIKELLHRILEVEGIVVAVDVVAAVLVVGGNVSVDGAFLRLDEVIDSSISIAVGCIACADKTTLVELQGIARNLGKSEPKKAPKNDQRFHV